MRTRETVIGAVLACGSLFGQTQPGQLAQPQDAGNTPAIGLSHPPAPLTVREKYGIALRRTFDPAEVVRLSFATGIDQLREYPKEWGEGWDSFGVRAASHFGQHLVKEQIEFGVWALDHEDPRHRRSGRSGVWPRVRYAVVRTFVTRSDSGKTMPSYSRFVGDYGAGFISRQWYPDRYHTLGQGFQAGTISLGIDVGMSVLREFWPPR